MLIDVIIWLIIVGVAGTARRPTRQGLRFWSLTSSSALSTSSLAGWLLPLAGFVLVGGIVAEIINAVIGEAILLAVIGFFKKRIEADFRTEAAA